MISAAIMAHPNRAVHAEALSDLLDLPIVWDQDNTVWGTARRAWLTYNPDATHHMVLQDDVIPAANLLKTVETLVEAVPDAPICLSTIGYRLHGARREYDKIVEKGNRWWWSLNAVSALGLIVPTSHIQAMVEHGDNELTKHDDLKIRSYFRRRQIKFAFPIPSLLDHRPIPSLSNPKDDGRYRSRGAVNFAGDTDCSQWDWSRDARRKLTIDFDKDVKMATYTNRRSRHLPDVTVEDGSRAQLRMARLSHVWERVDVPVKVDVEPEHFVPEPVVRSIKEMAPDIFGQEPVDDPLQVFSQSDDDAPQPPPKAGRGSSEQAWRDYAALHGIELHEGGTRSDIIGWCEAAGVA